MTKIIKLGLKDLDRIVQVERAAFIPPIQATREKIQARLKKGHTYLGIEDSGKLIGTLACRKAFLSQILLIFNKDFWNKREEPVRTVISIPLDILLSNQY